ncbi:MAG: GNAT family N-acetyltransferase [Stackebrandtia sp.]
MNRPTQDVSALPVRRLAPTELAACQSLAYSLDFHHPDKLWKLLFDLGEVHGIFDDDGDVVSTGALVRFGDKLATIGMVLTDARFGGRGLAKRVMRRLLERAGDAVTTLYATDRGRPLYDKLGFVVTGNNSVYIGRPEFGAAPSPRSRPATPADLPGMLDLDSRAMGADRSDLVVRLFDYAERLRVVERDGRIAGYASGWRHNDKLVMGPVLAYDGADATALLDDVAATWRGQVRLEVSSLRPRLAEWALACGLTRRAVVAIMASRDDPPTGEPDFWHTPVSLAIN